MKSLSYFVIILITHYAAFPIESLIHHAIHSVFLKPRAELVLRWVHVFVRWEGLWRLALWGVGSFGSILGYLLGAQLLGRPERANDWWAVFLAAALICMSRIHSIYSFEFYDIVKLFDSRETGFVNRVLRPRLQPILARALSEDPAAAMFTFLLSVCFHALLQLLASFALLLFASVNLNLVHAAGASPFTLSDALVVSFSTIGAAPADTPRLVGTLWLAMRMALGVTVLIWVVAFVAFAISTLPKTENLERLFASKSEVGKEAEPSLALPDEAAPPNSRLSTRNRIPGRMARVVRQIFAAILAALGAAVTIWPIPGDWRLPAFAAFITVALGLIALEAIAGKRTDDREKELQATLREILDINVQIAARSAAINSSLRNRTLLMVAKLSRLSEVNVSLSPPEPAKMTGKPGAVGEMWDRGRKRMVMWEDEILKIYEEEFARSVRDLTDELARATVASEKLINAVNRRGPPRLSAFEISRVVVPELRAAADRLV